MNVAPKEIKIAILKSFQLQMLFLICLAVYPGVDGQLFCSIVLSVLLYILIILHYFGCPENPLVNSLWSVN